MSMRQDEPTQPVAVPCFRTSQTDSAEEDLESLARRELDRDTERIAMTFDE